MHSELPLERALQTWDIERIVSPIGDVLEVSGTPSRIAISGRNVLVILERGEIRDTSHPNSAPRKTSYLTGILFSGSSMVAHRVEEDGLNVLEVPTSSGRMATLHVVVKPPTH